MNAKHRPKNFWCKTLSIFLAMMVLAGCSSGGAVVSSSDDEREALTQKSEATMEIPTKTPIPTDTPLPPTNTPEPTDTPLPPTSTPVPTATQRPTATALPPPPDAKAMIAWKELGLPGEYEAFSPEEMGIQEGALSFGVSIGGEDKEYNISGSFVFANGENPDTWIYGYTILLPTSDDRQIFDQLIDDIENFGGELTALDGTDGIGNHSKGAAGEVGDDRLTTIAFRIHDIGAFVFLRHNPTDEPGIDVKHIAEVYANSIHQPASYCAITSANAVPNADFLTFEVEAEGFYPQEGRYIILDGAIELEGETIEFSAVKLGGTGETVDPDGRLSDVISVYIKEQLAAKGYQNVGPIEGPIEFTLTVGGHFSGCEATQTVIWP